MCARIELKQRVCLCVYGVEAVPSLRESPRWADRDSPSHRHTHSRFLSSHSSALLCLDSDQAVWITLTAFPCRHAYIQYKLQNLSHFLSFLQTDDRHHAADLLCHSDDWAISLHLENFMTNIHTVTSCWTFHASFNWCLSESVKAKFRK